MRHIIGLLLIAFLLSATALAQDNSRRNAKDGSSSQQPSVLVTTQTPRQGSLSRTMAAYGTVQASPDRGSETLSLLRGGQITHVLVVVGQAVRKGQKLLAISADPATLAAYQQAVTAVEAARGQRTRTARMLAQRLATRDQLAQADKTVSDAQSNLDALNRAGGGSSEQTLTASFDGFVASVMVTPGARMAPQAPLMTLSRANRLVAIVGVEPARRGLVAPGQPARIEPLDGGTPVSGSVISVGVMLDPQSRLVPVLIDPPENAAQASPKAGESMNDPTRADRPEELMPGGPVRVVIQVGEAHGWLVPRDAVLTDAKGAYLFQVNDGKAARVEVKVLDMSGGTTLVAGPLDPSRPLVTSGNYQLQDGGAVRENGNIPVAGKEPGKP